MLKKIALIVFLTLQLYAMPKWYEEHSYISKGQTYYGYGEGRTPKMAKSQALEEIAQQINSKVSTTISINSNNTDEYISQSIDASTFIQSKQTLRDTKILKSEKQNSKYYVLLKHIHTTPLWYISRSFDAPLFHIIGYGVGSSLKKATISAHDDIASQIQTNISSSITISDQEKDSISTSTINSKMSSSSEAILKDTKIIKSEKIGENYFVAIMLKKIPNLKCIKQTNPYLAHSELIKKANSQTSCNYNYSLQRMNNSWYLYADGWTQQLNYSQFDSFFTSLSSPTLSINSQYSSYQVDDVFTLDIKSKNDGYLSIITVYENGKVGVMLENRPIRKGETLTFPSYNDNFELIAGLNEQNEATKDLYFAFVSTQKINLAKFEPITDELLDEKTYRFNKVINLCSKYDFATILIRTTLKTKIKRFSNVERVDDKEGFSWFFTDKLKSAIDDLEHKEPESKKWAFIISIEDYEFSDSIKYAKNSGEVFKLMMNKKLAVPQTQTIYLNNSQATASNISKKLDQLSTKVKKGDTIYFYFVGQGLPNPEKNNEPYLLAYDKSVGNFSNDKNLKLANILKTLSSSNASKIFVFLDTTFSGATDGVSVFKGVAAPKLRPKKIKINTNKMNVYIAGKETQFSNKYSQKRHRMFTYFLIDAIVNQKIDNANHLFEYVKTQVNQHSFELGDDYIQTPKALITSNTKL